MSTPSTATATLAHPQFYSHHQSYQPPLSNLQTLVNGASRLSGGHLNGFNTSNSSSSDLHRPASANTRRANQLPPLRNTDSSADMAHSSGRKDRKPNWDEFYKNGVPEEIIVIDDDSPPPQSAKVGTSTTTATAKATEQKRKPITSAADERSLQKPSYSTTQTPYYDNSSSNQTASTDRTTSAYNTTTAATSLGSQASNGTYQAYEDATVGQKRKRTRATADDTKVAKRREVQHASPYTDYRPPPRPPIKAKEVYVPVVPDRSFLKDHKVDDDDGHYNVLPDTDLTDRYKIIKLLGQGTFGKVVEAWDREKQTKCAIKVIRSVQKYRDASRIELRVLSTLASNDRHNRNRCIHLRHCFDFRNHICIVTDLYGQSVFDFLKMNQFTPFPNTHIQTFARQLFTSVAFLHDLNLIHTDLKPENILLVDNTYQTFTYNRTIPSSSTATNRSSRHRKVLLNPEIRLIDFGSATFDDEYHSSVVSTRHYRAPEIILNLGWSFPCDIWSIGCILVEFYTGDALFQTHDNLEHLAMMEAVVGQKIDKPLVTDVNKKKSNSASQYFNRQKRLDYPNADTPRNSRRYVKAMKRLDQTINQNTSFNKQFTDLLKKIFVYDPHKRITAIDALRHPWFKETLQDDGTEATRIREERERTIRRDRSYY